MAGLLDILGGLGGSIGAKQIQDDSYTSQQQNLQHIYDQIRQIPVPDAQKLQILLNLPQVAGQLSPQQLSSIGLGPTALANIPQDQTREAQLGALQQLQGLSKTGLTPADLAGMRQLQQQTEAQQQSNDAGLIQQMAQRGMGGGGSELALRALNAQQATNRLSNNSDQIAQAAQARALQALSSAGNLSGTMRTQDYQEAQNKANAIDTINRYNAMNQQGVAQQNVQANNQAQGFNVQNAQNVANARTNTQNQQQMYNAQIPQLQFQDAMSKAQGMENPAVSLANIEANRGKANAGYALGLGQSAGAIGQNLFNTFMNQGGEVTKTTEDGQGGYYSGYNKGGMVGEKTCYADGGIVQVDPNPMAMSPADMVAAAAAKKASTGMTAQPAAQQGPTIGGDLSKILDKIRMMSMMSGSPTTEQANNTDVTKMAYKGGRIQHYDQGGVVEVDPNPMAMSPADIAAAAATKAASPATGSIVPQQSGPTLGGDFSKILENMRAMNMIGSPQTAPADNTDVTRVAYKGGQVAKCYDDGGIVKADPNPMATPPKAPEQDKNSDMIPSSLALMAFAKTGGIVPGMPKVPGNSIKNDIVPVMASPGEIFIPRSHSTNINKAHSFLDNIFKENKAI